MVLGANHTSSLIKAIVSYRKGNTSFRSLHPQLSRTCPAPASPPFGPDLNRAGRMGSSYGRTGTPGKRGA